MKFLVELRVLPGWREGGRSDKLLESLKLCKAIRS